MLKLFETCVPEVRCVRLDEWSRKAMSDQPVSAIPRQQAGEHVQHHFRPLDLWDSMLRISESHRVEL
jgi:hypothetical protein